MRTLAGAAASVAAITVLARAAGFGRVVVFDGAVGDNCLGDVYTAANLVPNVLFEVVAGGVLAGVLVPLLAGPLASGDARERERASRTASAVLTWSVLALLAVSAVAALLARPVVGALLEWQRTGGCGSDPAPVALFLLYVFLPQVPLYGIAVVLGGALQAQRRFTAPAAAPLVSSLVVAGAYLLFAALLPAGVDPDAGALAEVPRTALAVLAGGTTLGVLAMVLTHLPALRSQVRWRPALRAAAGDGPRLRRLAAAGLAVLLAQQAVSVVAVLLALSQGAGEGAVVRWSYAWTLFLLPYAVLAVPVATAVFPRLAAAGGAGDPALAPLLAGTSRLVVLAGAAGAAVLAGAAVPTARFFALDRTGRVDGAAAADLAGALVLLAPALLGFGLTALLVRALYAVGRGRSAALAGTTGWAVVLVLAPVLAAAWPGARVVSALALAHAVGLTAGGVLLAVAVRSACGAAALAGLVRAAAAGAVAAAAGGAAGQVLAPVLPSAGRAAEVLSAAACAVVALAVWAAVVALLDRRDVAVLAGRLGALVPGGRGGGRDRGRAGGGA
ncbi:lipid II flippase MurJ [Kineococcus sp. NUM-3379]